MFLNLTFLSNFLSPINKWCNSNCFSSTSYTFCSIGTDYEFEEYCPDFDESDYDFDEMKDFANEVINSLEIKRDGVNKLIEDTNSILITATEEKETCEFVKNIISDLENSSNIYDV